MHMYLDLTSGIELLTWSFMVNKSDIGVLTSPGLSIGFLPAVIFYYESLFYEVQ